MPPPLFINHSRSAFQAGTYITHRVIYYPLVVVVFFYFFIFVLLYIYFFIFFLIFFFIIIYFLLLYFVFHVPSGASNLYLSQSNFCIFMSLTEHQIFIY